MHLRFLLALVGGFTALPAVAGELRVYPSEVSFTGPNRAQQLIVVEEENGRVVKDHTATAKFAASAEKVARAGVTGRVTATGNGDATITASVDGRSATAKVTVSGFEKPVEWSFRNHVIPTFTRIGCNSG